MARSNSHRIATRNVEARQRFDQQTREISPRAGMGKYRAFAQICAWGEAAVLSKVEGVHV
jgi:hypothetical protein